MLQVTYFFLRLRMAKYVVIDTHRIYKCICYVYVCTSIYIYIPKNKRSFV